QGDFSTVCGKPKVMGKIYGGQDVVAGQWPWQAGLLYHNTHICGAVLINSFWLVSTAHCFLNKSGAPEDYQVLLGSTQLYQHTQNARKMSVNRIIMHPDFEKFHPFGDDIAMLQLHLPVNFTSYISPACLPAPGMLPSRHSSCWITGWGMLSEDKQLLPPFHLQEGKVGLIENKLCNMLYGQRLGTGKTNSVHEEMLCAGDILTGKAICQGDSGSPLVCDLLDAWVLVGLASWGLDCRHPIYPSVFTNVTYFADWIREIQRLTPPPDPTAALPQTQLPYGPLQAAGSPGPARTTRKAVPSAQCAHTLPLPRETESRNGIPPEAEQEDMDIMDELPMGAPGGGWEDEEMEWLQDEGLLSYLDQLCSQEDFVSQ
ncbi:PREDICTED: putative serine protease 47, partial [Myotis brandtii]|uniref:putative serine protease 47 n=1 Tax=Myotis brandtii TaxID=109478 RepID=UPI000703D35F